MKTLFKLALIGAVLIVVLLVAGVFAAVASINTLAERGIEKGATYALGVPTTLDGASIGLFSGELGLSGLKIDNPPDYKAPHFMTLGQGDVAVSLASLRQDTVRIPRFTLDTVDVRLERKSGSSNYGQILDNVKKVTGSDKEPAPKADPGSGKKFVIDELLIKDITVTLDMLGLDGAAGAIVGDATRVTVPIKEIKLDHVGQTGTGVKGSGVTMSELASLIVEAVLAATVEQGGGLIPSDILGDLQGRLASLGNLDQLDLSVIGDLQKNLGEQAGKAVDDAVKKVTDEAGKAVEDAAKKAEDAVKDLFPGSKKKDSSKDEPK